MGCCAVLLRGAAGPVWGGAAERRKVTNSGDRQETESPRLGLALGRQSQASRMTLRLSGSTILHGYRGLPGAPSWLMVGAGGGGWGGDGSAPQPAVKDRRGTGCHWAAGNRGRWDSLVTTVRPGSLPEALP